MTKLEDEEKKALVKEALSEWLDKQAASFGRFSFKFFRGAALVAVLYLWLGAHGWHP